MKCVIMYSTPAISRKVLREHQSFSEARTDLKEILQRFKRDYRKGQHVRDHCYWHGKNKIVVQRINNDGEVSGDRLEYWIELKDKG